MVLLHYSRNVAIPSHQVAFFRANHPMEGILGLLAISSNDHGRLGVAKLAIEDLFE
jgi:hypothetical protein